MGECNHLIDVSGYLFRTPATSRDANIRGKRVGMKPILYCQLIMQREIDTMHDTKHRLWCGAVVVAAATTLLGIPLNIVWATTGLDRGNEVKAIGRGAAALGVESQLSPTDGSALALEQGRLSESVGSTGRSSIKRDGAVGQTGALVSVFFEKKK